jgi:hypothetical protein
MPANAPAMNGRPKTTDELFPSRYLKADDLHGKAARVTISQVDFEALRQRDGTQKVSALVYFAGARKCLVLNKTQATEIAEIAGSKEFDKWPGTVIQIAPGRAPNGKPTIVVSRPAPQPANGTNGTTTPPPAPTNGQPTATTSPAGTGDDARGTTPQPTPTGTAEADPAAREFDAWPSASANMSERAKAK